MSESGNGKARLTIIGLLLTGAGLCLGAGSGWMAAVKGDAAFKQRAETFMATNDDIQGDVAALQLSAAVATMERAELREGQKQMQESIRRMADKIDLLISSQMREGRVPR